jgi:type IV fimbrial biogenesis protein FimT
MSSLKSTNYGFTLTELLVTIAIAAILLAVATPSLRNIALSNRIQGATAEFQSALSIARAEAIKRGGDARVTVVANSKSGTTPNWASGVTVFYDTTSNANGDAPPTDASKLIMKTGALSADVSVAVNFNHIIYNGLGRTINSAGTPLGGTVAFGASDIDWRCTIISLTGRIRSTKVSSAAYNSTQCSTS